MLGKITRRIEKGSTQAQLKQQPKIGENFPLRSNLTKPRRANDKTY